MDFFRGKENAASWMYDCEGIFAAWTTNPATVRSVLPPPLEYVSPVVRAYIINVFDPTFSSRYHEAGLVLTAMYNGRPGEYNLGTLLKGADNGVLMGREIADLPRKNAECISLARIGDSAHGSVTRDDVRLIEIECDLCGTGGYNNPKMAEEIFGARKPGEVLDSRQYSFRFDCVMEEGHGAVVSGVKLNDSHVQTRIKTFRSASVHVTLRSTANDPWAEMKVIEMIGAGWSRVDIGLLGSELIPLGEDNTAVPYLLNRYDSPAFGKPNRSFCC
ncbi:MAG: acetoacetate decarboxylase family protein [Synergistaceae bacterium]|nr:acetoacetate decarboxylase family protein [Synergistaceae bacterium]